MRIKLIAVVLLIILNGVSLQAQSVYIGIQPMLTVEPFYPEGEFDVNLAPLVAGIKINSFIDLKLATLLNYHFGTDNHIRHIGVEVNAPVYFFDISSDFDKSQKTLFAAPVLAFAYNSAEKSNEFTLCAEVGYTFLFDSLFELKLGLQEGATWFFTDNKIDKIVNHFGVKISFGKWF